MKMPFVSGRWLLVLAAALAGCATAPNTMEGRRTLHEDVLNTVADYKQRDPGVQRFFDTAYGYAVFPSIGSGAVGVGGAFGRGELYEKGQWVGHCSVTQGSIGPQLGGKSYSEIIFFQDAATLNGFKSNELAFDATASAVAASSGGSSSADYRKGVLVFTEAEGGLMLQAAIGGQKFSFEPDVNAQRTTDVRP